MLRACGNVLYPHCAELKDIPMRNRFLAWPRRRCGRASNFPATPPARPRRFRLGMTLYYGDRFADSVAVLRQAVESTRVSSLQEDRQLRLADALRKSGDSDGARDIYQKLSASTRDNVRESAQFGLNAIRQSDPKP